MLIVVAALVGAIVLLTLALVVRPYSIPSASNVPTLQVGDIILASKAPYGISRYSLPIDLGFRGRIFGHAPRRGDVAVFALPRDPTVTYVKRVIGLPGETVQMKEGRLYINGAMVPREPIAKIRTEGYDGRETEVPTYREILPGGVTYTVIEVQGDTGFNDNTDPFVAPADSYFVMGDNRDNSLDSRAPANQGGVGFVPIDNFIAHADLILGSHDSARMLKLIH